MDTEAQEGDVMSQVARPRGGKARTTRPVPPDPHPVPLSSSICYVTKKHWQEHDVSEKGNKKNAAGCLYGPCGSSRPKRPWLRLHRAQPCLGECVTVITHLCCKGDKAKEKETNFGNLN